MIRSEWPQLQEAICPGCGAGRRLGPADLGQRTVCPGCGQAFHLLPPSTSPPTVVLLEDPDLNHLAGRLWLDLRPGQILDNDFLVRRPLGRGGLSQVLQVLDLKRNFDLAVKLPLASTLGRLPREVLINEAAAWLRPAPHPNLVACDQVRLYYDQPLIFMEYIQGRDLARLTAEGRNAPPCLTSIKLLDVFIQVARGLGYAHSLGLSHLDIKPRNVLVEQDGGRALIGDYGPVSWGTEAEIAELDMGGGQSGTQETRISGTRLLGTPQYFSPETASGRLGTGGDADLWALALTILECFLGCRPWEVGSMAGLALEQYLAGRGRPASLPPGLDDYFRQALASNPADRIREAKGVEERLTGIYEKMNGRPYGRPEVRTTAETPEGLARRQASLKALRL